MLTYQCWGYNYYGELGDNTTIQRLTPVDVLSFKSAKNDFDGDAKSDVLFLNSTTGGTQYWKSATKSQAIYPGTYDNVNYSYSGGGDFDGDGKADLLWINSSTHGIEIWSGVRKGQAYESYPGIYATGFSVQK